MSPEFRAQRPVLEGEMWHIGNNPDLGELHREGQEVVDHGIWQSDDGRWHLLACIRGTRVGRLLYAWEGADLHDTYWEPQGVKMRVNRQYGESIDDRNGEEWIQAPHVIKHEDLYYMFYGGHNTEMDVCQICVATSTDGRDFMRYRDEQNQSRVFVGPGEARDPMVLRIADGWHCYYVGHDPGQREPCKIYCRTSRDLYHWSDYQEVNWGGSGGDGPWSAECAHVVYRYGYYYLFRTSRYAPPAVTHVYRSRDPLDFGLGDDSHKIGELQVAAPEVIVVGDDYYISTVEDLEGGVQLSRLRWEDDAEA